MTHILYILYTYTHTCIYMDIYDIYVYMIYMYIYGYICIYDIYVYIWIYMYI